ncbi:MAG: FkbM family methyltransferase [Actinophytocola sp.]|uniref:FkbM family methyltransferase n=1 Tax=Actinophytocola sp. TaxID=1872138 RepID=UPI00132C1400|nr:FkbM family methyltransferase [Actinophytocola sp.]MPZ85304.1 FkbM family methyltransferase [Actinophytocola sp.]
MNHVVDVHRPVSGDVIDLILDDHRLFEELLRNLRDAGSDRPAVRDALATVLVAHAEAAERFVYPKLRKRSAVGAHEAEHGSEEHAEGHEALLKVLELKGTDTQAFEDAVEELTSRQRDRFCRSGANLPEMFTVSRHGREIHFPQVVDATEVPYTYRPFRDGGWYEKSFLEHIRRQGRRGVYVDAGAHLGTHTAWFAMLCPSTHVHAIEPVTRFADQLDRIVEANALTEHVTVHRVGVSDRPGTATSHLSAEHQIGFDPAGAPMARDETFSVTTLDELVHEPVAVIKIDVEGMEERVLRGASRILSAYRPNVYVEAWNRDTLRGIVRAIRPFGYGPTGRVFNSTPTYEFSPTTAVHRVTGPVLLAVRHTSRAARRWVGAALKRG